MCKTSLSNSIRGGLVIPLLASILRLCGLINSDIAVDKETPRMVPGLPNLRPFDLFIAFDHMLGESNWRTPLSRLGINVTVVHALPQFVTTTKVAQKNEIYLRLRNGEELKFQRRGKSCKETGVTLTGDEIIASILRAGMGFLPFAVSAHGRIGSLLDS